MAGTSVERMSWSMERDDQGYKTYNVKFQVLAASVLYGPNLVSQTAGLPLPGSFWAFGGDVDPFAYCTPYMKATPVIDKEKGLLWEVEQKFTTKPQSLASCSNQNLDNPLLVPPKLSGSFTKFSREATHDRFGNLLKSSSHEQFRGPQVEFDQHDATVQIEINSAALGLDVTTLLMNKVNSVPMWGVPARYVKLSEFSWTRNTYGTCSFYYTRTFGFEISARFDRQVIDEGNNVLNGHWDRETTSGSGCTLDITADANGGITAATVNAAGTGYAESATITLKVVSGVGSGGRVTVITNGSGAVTSVVRVSSAGVNYTSASGAATTRASGWILDDVNGGPPDKNNPQHFIRATDLKGDPIRVLLNGGGEPLEDDADPYVFDVENYDEYNFFLLGIPVTL